MAFFSILIVFPGICASAPLWEGAASRIWDDPAALLGWTLEEAFEKLGPPMNVLPLRGEQEWQDDVVFHYGSGLSLFWFQDRVWQVRIDSSFSGNFMDLKIGLSPEEVSRILERPPASSGEDWEVYFLPGYDFPLGLQVFYRENQAVDYYLYRGDF